MINRPTGTVTFLFTDIERSTKLWEEHRDAMQIALGRHDAQMRKPLNRTTVTFSKPSAMRSARHFKLRPMQLTRHLHIVP
jgi:hypothetical protein